MSGNDDVGQHKLLSFLRYNIIPNNIIFLRWNQAYACSFISLCGGLLCLLWQINLKGGASRRGVDDDVNAVVYSPLQHTIFAENHVTAVLITIILAIPIAIESLFDISPLVERIKSVFANSEMFQKLLKTVGVSSSSSSSANIQRPTVMSDPTHWLVRAGLIIVLTVPQIWLYACASLYRNGVDDDEVMYASYRIVESYLCTVYFRHVVTMGIVMIFASTREYAVLQSNWSCATVLAMYTIGEVLRLFSYRTASGALHSTGDHSGDYNGIVIASCVFELFAFIELIRLTSKWAYDSYFKIRFDARLRLSEAVQAIDICILLYLVAVIAECVGAFSISAANVGFMNPFTEASVESVSGIEYTQIAFLIIIMMIPGRAARLEAIEKSSYIEGKRTFYQYISHEMRTPLNTVMMGLSCMKDDISLLRSNLPSDGLGGGRGSSLYESIESLDDTLNEVGTSCQVTLAILDELLLSDKMESGKLTLELDYCAPLAFVLSTVKPFAVQARMKNVELTATFGSRPTSLRSSSSNSELDRFLLCVDQNKIGQVMRNLLSNALKFVPVGGNVRVVIRRISRRAGKLLEGEKVSERGEGGGLVAGGQQQPQGGGRNRVHPMDGLDQGAGAPTDDNQLRDPISASAAPASDEAAAGSRRAVDEADEFDCEQFLRVEVTDNGAGISVENQKLLFKKFMQFDASKLQKGGGTGLGLWISKGIVDLHGGVIGATSGGEGEGATFFFELPLLHKEDAIAAAQGDLASERSDQTGIADSNRILQRAGIISDLINMLSGSLDSTSAGDRNSALFPARRRNGGFQSSFMTPSSRAIVSGRVGNGRRTSAAIVQQQSSRTVQMPVSRRRSARLAPTAVVADDVNFAAMAHHIFQPAIGSRRVSFLEARSGNASLRAGDDISRSGKSSPRAGVSPTPAKRNSGGVNSARFRFNDSNTPGGFFIDKASSKGGGAGSGVPEDIIGGWLTPKAVHTGGSSDKAVQSGVTSPLAKVWMRSTPSVPSLAASKHSIPSNPSNPSNHSGGGSISSHASELDHLSSVLTFSNRRDTGTINGIGNSSIIITRGPTVGETAGDRDDYDLAPSTSSRVGSSFLPRALSGLEISASAPVGTGAGRRISAGHEDAATDPSSASIAPAPDSISFRSQVSFQRRLRAATSNIQALNLGHKFEPDVSSSSASARATVIGTTAATETSPEYRAPSSLSRFASKGDTGGTTTGDLISMNRQSMASAKASASPGFNVYGNNGELVISSGPFSAISSKRQSLKYGGTSGDQSRRESTQERNSPRGGVAVFGTGEYKGGGGSKQVKDEEDEEGDTVPVSPAIADLAELQRQDREERRPPPAALTELNILLVDDSAPNRKMLRRLLVNNNLTSSDILEASDGLECLRVFDEEVAAGRTIDIIIMDDSMPNMCGPEAARELRAKGYLGLICGVTGNILPTDIQRYVDFGATCVLAKPLNLQLLKRQIAKFYGISLP